MGGEIVGLWNRLRAAVQPSYWTTFRRYDAASHGRQNANWTAFNESAELTDRWDRDLIRARARDLERNSDICQAVLHAYKRNVVGKGYTLRAKSPDETTNKALEQLWREWCKARNCDVTGEQSLNQILRMAVERKRVDGGMLFVWRHTRDGVVPFQIQLFEVDELASDQLAPHAKGNRVVGGVEYNRYRKPVGYWFRQYDLEGWQTMQPVWIDAKDVYFYKSKRRPSQLREMSDLTPTITRVRDTNEFITAVSIKERIAACLAIFIKRTMPASGIGRGAVRTETGKVDYDSVRLTPGMVKELGAGDDVSVVDPRSAGTDAASFLKVQQSLIASGQGLSYETVSRDMSQATYSSARQNAIEDEATYAEDVELVTDLLTEIYEQFVISAVLSGAVAIPEFWENKRAYLSHTWVKPPKKWIDPAKESSAYKTALQSGQKTFQDVCAEQGKDWKDAVDEMAELLAYGKQAGINIGGVVFGNGFAAADDAAQ